MLCQSHLELGDTYDGCQRHLEKLTILLIMVVALIKLCHYPGGDTFRYILQCQMTDYSPLSPIPGCGR